MDFPIILSGIFFEEVYLVVVTLFLEYLSRYFGLYIVVYFIFLYGSDGLDFPSPVLLLTSVSQEHLISRALFKSICFFTASSFE